MKKYIAVLILSLRLTLLELRVNRLGHKVRRLIACGNH